VLPVLERPFERAVSNAKVAASRSDSGFAVKRVSVYAYVLGDGERWLRSTHALCLRRLRRGSGPCLLLAVQRAEAARERQVSGVRQAVRDQNEVSGLRFRGQVQVSGHLRPGPDSWT